MFTFTESIRMDVINFCRLFLLAWGVLQAAVVVSFLE